MAGIRFLRVAALTALALSLSQPSVGAPRTLEDKASEKICPKTIYGKWKPYSRNTDWVHGAMEIRRTGIVFGRWGEFRFTRHQDEGGHPFFALDRPISGYPYVSPVEYRFLIFEYPKSGLSPDEKCLLWLRTCETEEEARNHVSGVEESCSSSTYLPFNPYGNSNSD